MNLLAAITLSLAILPIDKRPYNHIFFVLLENVGYEAIVGDTVNAPYINNKLIRQGVLYTQSFGITHPSLPNYLAIFSGDTQGVTNDRCDNGPFAAPNLWEEMNAGGMICKGYMEDLPYAGAQMCQYNGLYYKRHNPFPFFVGIPGQAWVPYVGPYAEEVCWTEFSFITPNVIHDMHTGATIQEKVHNGDTWLSQHLPPIISYANSHNGLVILTMDEGRIGNHILTILVGPGQTPGTQVNTPVNHYNTLKTVTDNFGLEALGNCAGLPGLY
jgi:hypothetical protein